MTSATFDLVTGAAGFSGMYVVRELLARGRRVVATDLAAAWDSADTARVLRAIGIDTGDARLSIIPADLLASATLAPLFERPIARVFHTASLYDYSASLAQLRRINVTGTRNLLDAASRASLERFVHWSTCGVFGKPYPAAAGKRTNLPFTEGSSSPRNTPADADGPTGTELVNDYSRSKWEQEKLVWRHAERGLPVTVIRPAPIYGPGSTYGHGGIILAIANGLVPVLPADAKHYVTTSVHVEDVARFACFAAERADTLGEDYDVVDDSIISYHEFLHYIALLTGRRIRDLPLLRLDRMQPAFEAGARAWRWLETSLHVARPRVFEVQSAAYMSSSYWLSNRKALATGFRYRYPDVREGLKDTIAWMREMGWLTDRRRLFVVSPGGAKAVSLR